MSFFDCSDAGIAEALRDAGCDEPTIAQFMQLKAEGKLEEGLHLLAKFRCRLVCKMHEAQKPVDVLDYVIAQMKPKKRQ